MLLTIDARLELFKKQFPKEKIKSVQEREGLDHSVLEINHTWMCKSSKTENGVALLAREAQLLNMLQGKITTTAIPVPLHYEDNFLVYKKIAGSPLISYAFYRLGNKQRSKLILEVAQFLLQLHDALNPEEIASLKLAKSDWPWSAEKLQAHRHHLEDNKDMLEVFDNIMQMNEGCLAESYEPKLIHNDMDIRNIIVDPLTGQLRGIIDFTDVAFDDPALDLRMRRDNPVEFARAIVLVYGMLRKAPQSSQKMYGYYFATEFSRYFEQLEQGNKAEAQKTFNEIVKTIRGFLNSHDDCDDADCGHSKEQAATPA